MRTIPKWGRITASPNEYLLVLRNGRVARHGQGISVFKWPSDSVALVPTTITELSFLADQVTREKVGVQVSGLAVYRIVEPLLAYRMIDFERSRLTDILRDMFVGATRRIIANLTLEECLTHRKERVASELLREIQPVLAGEGTLSDETSQGWGVVLDTIEIQDVRVLSEEVFRKLQAPYRDKLSLEAVRSADEVSREQARLAEERAKEAERMRLERMAQEEARLAAERKRAEDARAHEEYLKDRAQEAELARKRTAAAAEKEREAIELLAKRARIELEAEATRILRAAETDRTPARLEEILLTETMPRLAEAFRDSFDTISVTSLGGSENLLRMLSAGAREVLSTLSERRQLSSPETVPNPADSR